MATIVDRRNTKDTVVHTNRQRFLQRYKDVVKSQVDKYIDSTKIKSIKDSIKEVKISKKDLKEPSYNYDSASGENDYIATGNKQYKKGDKIKKPKGNGGSSGGSGSDKFASNPEDFTFTLTKEEFLDIFFEDMALPNFIKKSFKKEFTYKMKRSGYTKVGSFSKLNLKKTFENSFMRRIASRASGKKPPFLDDIDLRFNLFTKQPQFIGQAAMFCVMDVSGSMDAARRNLAKRFYILLYLFLEKVYREVDIHFIIYHDSAREVPEEEFFNPKESGGTLSYTGIEEAYKIINEKYSDGLTNLYLAHASDGDDFDNAALRGKVKKILPLLQYMIYLEVQPPTRSMTPLMYVYKNLRAKLKNEKLNIYKVFSKEDIFPALRELFKKQEE